MRATELLGRNTELARLGVMLDDARLGHQQLALVGGDAGIGKTALVARYGEAAEEAGLRVHWGRCWEGGGGAPFWPWVQVLRACLEEIDDDVLAGLGPAGPDLAQVIPELRSRVPGHTVPSTPDSPDARLRLFGSVASFLAVAAHGAGGMVVVLEDVHAADEGSLQLLHYLARRTGPVPLVIVATYRVTEVVQSEMLSVAIDALSRCGATLHLRGLATEEVGTLLERAGAGMGRVDARRVHDATDGNPFLVYEAARLLSAHAPDGRAGVVLPTDSQALIRQRLDPVPLDQRAVLTAGAILGREFDLHPLSRMLGRPPSTLIDALSDAVDLAVVEELQIGRWSFTHALLREALLDRLEPAERARLHRRAGEVLRSIHGDADGPVVARIAAHLHAALAGGGDVAETVDLCVRAATIASATLAYEESARWYERALEALDLVEPPDEHRRYDLLVAMAEVATRRGNVRVAAEAHRRAIRAARAMGSVELAARAAVQVAPVAVSDALVIGALDDALCDLPDEDDPLRARVLVSFARVLSDSYLTRNALLDISDQGLEMARRVGDPETQWWTFWQWHQNALASPGTLEERQRVAGELIAIAERSGDLERRQLARQWRAANLMEQGDLAAARAELETRMKEAEELRQPLHLWSATSALASVAIAEGRLEEGERLARQALTLGEDLDWVNTEVAFNTQLSMIRRHQGVFDELERITLNALETWTVTGWECGRQFPLLLSLIHRGHATEARARLDKVLGPGVEKLFVVTDPEGARVELTEGRGCCSAAVAELVWLVDDRERAAPLYERMLPRRGVHIVSGDGSSRGAIDRHLGQLAALAGRFTEADGHFETAHRLHELMGTPIWGAYGKADHARMLELRSGPGDRARAADLLAAAAATFARLGMGFYERQARQGLDDLLSAGSGLRMRKEGESWAVAFGGVELRIRDSRGIRYLARLVASPGQELHALDLVVGDGRGPATVARDEAATGGGDAGVVLDAEAKAAYRRRLDQLRERGDRSDDVRREIAFLEAELGAAVGLGGRDRRVASDAERARQSVTKALKDALDRLDAADPGLGRHLKAAVRTGTYSSYSPS